MPRLQPPGMALAVAAGVALIAFGLLRKHSATGPVVASTTDTDAAQAGGGLGLAVHPGRNVDRASTVTVVLRHAGDRSPAVGATVALWRRATGEGVARRSARRLVAPAIADAAGRVTLVSPVGVALEIHARAAGGGPLVRTPLAPLRNGESPTIEVRVERPPAPTRVVVKGTSGAPLLGASIWAVSEPRPVPTTFPGADREMLRRTDKRGVADLTGAARSYTWILVDAAGYSPFAISAAAFRRMTQPLEREDRRELLAVTLKRAGVLDISVTAVGGEAARQAEVRISYALDGLAVTCVYWTDRRGGATVRGLPAGIPLTIEVTPQSASGASYRNVVQAVAGERRTLDAELTH